LIPVRGRKPDVLLDSAKRRKVRHELESTLGRGSETELDNERDKSEQHQPKHRYEGNIDATIAWALI
jgi:hypothetical protein